MLKNKIYTPADLYSDFVPNLPLRDSIVSDERVGDVVYNEVYFNGRATDEGRVLIYGILARHDDGKKHNAILIIPDYESGMDINVVNLYVKLGYDVLMFDYKGESDDVENYTHYPSQIKYANLKYAGRHLDYADISAKETCWYEWCCVARYAVSFLRSRLETNKIGVLGIKNGADIMWHLISCDTRITCAVGLFGAGWRAYKGIAKYGDAEEFYVDDERIRYLAGVDPHVYAPFCKCPVALFASTNSAKFDADRAHDTIRRVNVKSSVDSFFCLSPRMTEAININCTRNIELFFGIYLNGQRIQKLREPTVFISVEGEAVSISVEADAVHKPRNVEIYVCENQVCPEKRNWVLLDEVTKTGEGSFVADYSLVNGGGMIFAIAVVEYRNGLTVSSPIINKKCPKTQIIKTNLIYQNEQKEGDFVCSVSDADLIADTICFRRSALEVVKGAMGIYGISSRTGLITYKVKENRVDITQNSIFKLDLYCDTEIEFLVYLYTDVGSEKETVYNISINVPKGEVWQNIVLAVKDFKTRDGMPVVDYDAIDKIEFKSNGFFAINNVLLI